MCLIFGCRPVQKMEVCLEAGPKWARCVPRATKKDIHWAFDPDTAQLREKDTRILDLGLILTVSDALYIALLNTPCGVRHFRPWCPC